MKRSRSSRWRHVCGWVSIAIVILTVVWTRPGLANNPVTSPEPANTPPRPTAPVVLDGRELFELGAAGPFSARERVSRVELGLEAALDSVPRTGVGQSEDAIDEVESPEEFEDADRADETDATDATREAGETGSGKEFNATEPGSGAAEATVTTPSGDRAIRIEIVSVEGNETIRINDRHLMTVTDSDIEPGLNTVEQAEIWRDLLARKLKRAVFERTPEYISDKREEALRVLGIAVVLYLGSWELDTVLRQRMRDDTGNRAPTSAASLNRNTSPPRKVQPRQTLLHLLLVAGQIVLWLFVLYYIAGLFPQSRQWRYSFVASFTRPVLLLGDRNSSVLDLVLLLTMLVALWFAVIWLTDRFRTQVLSVTGADRGIQDITIVLSRCVLLFVGLSIVLQVWGIDLASLAVLLSALSVGIGFGLQNIANNFISGIIISFDRSMKVGDFVQLDELMGTVERIGARSTEIRTPDYVSIVVPNSRFLEQALVNWSHGNPVSRIGIPVGVAYGTDSERVREALLEVARGYEPLLLAPEPQVWFRGFGDSSLDFELLVWIRDPQNQFRYSNELNYRVYDALARYDIEIPFPQRDIHIRTQPEPESNRKSAPDRPVVETSSDALSSHPPVRLPAETGAPDDLREIVRQMRSRDGGLTIRDRRYGLTMYSNTFIGSEAVDWLCDRYGLDRATATDIGKQIVARGFGHHVTDDRDFHDAMLFYRFYQDET